MWVIRPQYSWTLPSNSAGNRRDSKGVIETMEFRCGTSLPARQVCSRLHVSNEVVRQVVLVLAALTVLQIGGTDELGVAALGG